MNISEMKNNDLIDEIKNLSKFLLNESGNITSFAGYDVGIGLTKNDFSINNSDGTTDYDFDKEMKYCNDFEIGVLDQGFFQMTQFNEEQWTRMRKYVEENRSDISSINFFFLSTTLVDAASPVITLIPVINIYHTAIGVQIMGNQKDSDGNFKIKRTMIFQLEFGGFDGIGDLAKRFLTPQFCMTSKKDKDGKVVNPIGDNFSELDFINNLFVDYSRSISSVMGNFLESADYMTQKIVDGMSCVDAANLKNSAPMPYDDFLRQNISMKQYYNAYKNYLNSENNIGGNADGTIFQLCGFGPSPLTQQAGAIVNFASCNDPDELIKIMDFIFTNYNGCSRNMDNANQHYCLLGVDKLYPIASLSSREIQDMLENKPNIVSTDNGFIREMRGRTTHCNTVCAVLVTLMENLSKENPDKWKNYTNWEDTKVQEMEFYMMNPAIPNIPIVEFSEGFEYGVSMKEFNYNPLYGEDKKKFHQYMFFIRMLANGMASVGEQAILNESAVLGNNSFSEKLFYYVIQTFQSTIAKDVIKFFSKSYFSKYKYTYVILMVLLILYMVVSLELYDEIYWVTGQPTVDKNGNPNINVTDPYPYIWKFNVKKNSAVLIAYIKNFFMSYESPNYKGMTAGDIYYNNLQNPSYTLFDDINQLNRWIHPFPMNKFYLWFPGIKYNNKCNKVELKENLKIYKPEIKYKFVKPGKSNSLSLQKWKGYQNNISSNFNSNNGNSDNKITIVLIITLIIMVLALSIFAYILFIKKK